jgi:amino acid transporter/phosphate uptake regulator
MPQAKKFNAFAGVFTPSVLTILGVIMYMRLGWVVGESGIWAALIIILVAHVISISTGLSISSIATDKKIKTGGIYYVLSRSLGLPMGGSIGITLFVGTALSIALYLVGFAENFLGIDAIRDFLHLGQDINSIRLVGTIALLILVAIALISTSLAIKSQFFILGAIAISLIAIIAGIFFNSSGHIPEISYTPRPGGVDFITVFAIFFPAVTGFTAGVAMSGDLKDPQKDIPKGTLLAIATGLIVYIGLALLLGFFVDRDTLVNDKNFIMKIAIWAPLVIAGIWGATLSSALGGILGGPRILQAVALDRIVPAFLGKGTGASNEPRNALILTFVIAEIGILIGELNAIAAVVSMFYIAAYGFINLAYALESWASTDFRPSFKISKWIGIIGFLASFGVMFQLNPGAMFAAFFFMWAIYFFLRRREVKLDYGDVWSSVWSSVMRSSLNRLNKQQLEDRNWQPNIILFSGGSKNRPHLVHFGKNLVGKHGFLSNFDLFVKKEDNYLFTKQEQNVADDKISEEYKGIFARRQSVKDIYDGIEQITSTYGFAGVEPNTVFLGWGRNSKDPKRFVKMVRNIEQLDLNVLMMDYDKERQFGDRKLIDIWWRGQGQNGNLSLQLVKFLWQSEDWEGARLRLIIVNPVNEEQGAIHKQALKNLENLRMDAEVKVINNQIEKKSFYEIVQTESINTDVIFMGLPQIKEGLEEKFIQDTNELCKKIGTVILIKASSSFKALNIGINKQVVQAPVTAAQNIIKQQEKLNIKDVFPQDSVRKNHIENTFEFMTEAKLELQEKTLGVIFHHKQNLLNDLKKHIQKGFLNLNYEIERKDEANFTSNIAEIHNNFLNEFHALIKAEWTERTKLYQDLLEKFILIKSRNIDRLIATQPKRLKVYYTKEELLATKEDSWDLKLFKFRKRMLMNLGVSKGGHTINNREIFKQLIMPKAYQLFEQINIELGAVLHQYTVELQKLAKHVDTIFLKIEIASKNEDLEAIGKYKSELLSAISQLQEYYEESLQLLNTKLDNNYIQLINALTEAYEEVDPERILDEEFNDKKVIRNFRNNMRGLGEAWANNQNYLYNQLWLNVSLLNFQTHLRLLSDSLKQQLASYIRMKTIARQTKLLQYLKNYKEELTTFTDAEFTFNENFEQVSNEVDFAADASSYLMKYTEDFPDSLEILSEEGFNSMSNQPYLNDASIKISTAQLLDYLVQNEFIESLKSVLNDIELEIARLNNRLNDHVRLISYSLYNEDEYEDGELSKDQIGGYIEREIGRLEKEIDESNELIKHNDKAITQQLNSTLDKISIVPFVHAAQDLKQYIRRQKDTRKGNILTALVDSTRKILKGRYAQFLYHQTRGLIITQRFLKVSENTDPADVNGLINAYNRLHIAPGVLEKVPFYYKQLFFRKHNYLQEFWVGRKEELSELNRAIENFKSGFDGGILIHGERHSGKSYFAHYGSSTLLPEYKLINVTPPIAGSTSVDYFYKTLRKATGLSGDAENIFHNLPKKSIFLFEDIELWWERRVGAEDVINEIKKLINKYGNDYLFLITSNSASYKVLNQTIGLSDVFIGKIEMQEFDSEEIKEMIMYRHQTSALPFTLNGKAEKQFKEWHFASLFNQYYRFTKGNPGFALNTWVNNIENFEDETLQIRRPLSRHWKEFKYFNSQTQLILIAFILHSSMTKSKLARILKIKEEEANSHLVRLKRSGILKEVEKGVFKVSKMIYHLIYKNLSDQKQI